MLLFFNFFLLILCCYVIYLLPFIFKECKHGWQSWKVWWQNIFNTFCFVFAVWLFCKLSAQYADRLFNYVCMLTKYSGLGLLDRSYDLTCCLMILPMFVFCNCSLPCFIYTCTCHYLISLNSLRLIDSSSS